MESKLDHYNLFLIWLFLLFSDGSQSYVFEWDFLFAISHKILNTWIVWNEGENYFVEK